MTPTHTSPKAWIGLLALLVAIKAIALLLDPAVRYFLGDSATYIHAALVATPPPDRSYTYPLLIRALALPWASLPVAPRRVPFDGIGVALLAFAILRDAFALDARIAGALALIVVTVVTMMRTRVSPMWLVGLGALAGMAGWV